VTCRCRLEILETESIQRWSCW